MRKTSMRETVHGAVHETRKQFDLLRKSMHKDAKTLTVDEQLARYVRLHRGNALAMGHFISKVAPPGMNPIHAMKQYEVKMEAELAKRGFDSLPRK